MEIGLLGGSFDPIHYGHLNMAQKAMEEYGLDEVWLIPSGHSPHKAESGMMSAAHRTAMCRLAAAHYERICVSTIEVDSTETSYTYRTITKLHAQYPMHQFSFIMGADSLDYLEHWRHPEIICAYARILVINRGEFTNSVLEYKARQLQSLYQAHIQFVHTPKVSVSSSEIRRRIAVNIPLDGLLWDDVIAYIRQNHLYGTNGE